MAATGGGVRIAPMYLLDTNIISELRRPRPHGGVVAWLRSVEDRHLHLSAVSFGEIQAGIERTRDNDPTKAAEIEAWADQVAETWNILPMDAATFRIWAKLMHRRSDDLVEDAMVAATARVHGLQVVTRNVKDFKVFGVTVVNPYDRQ
jgi:predicted nucleic acid-binding protein